jgi:beta-glucosidase
MTELGPAMSDVIDDLLRRMSLTEKIGQLNHPNAGGVETTGAGVAVADIETRIRRGEVGSLAAGAPLPQLKELQRIAVEESPNRIPLFFSVDVIHGHRTIFPLPLALSGAFDPALVERTARAAAIEAAAAGVTLAWAPMLDVSRDARWGRCAESPGEDPYLGARLAEAMVRGYQGDDLARADNMMACAKHFAGYGFAEGGRDYNAVDASPYRMHNVVLPPFKRAVEAGVGAVMVGFHDLAGIPCTAHRELLHDLLRKAWGFDGLIVSDYTAIMELMHHGVAADEKEAAYLAFHATVDIDLVSECYMRHLPALVAEGRIAESEIDAACRRVLVAKQKLGLFAQPYRGLDEEKRRAVTLTRDTRKLAREAAAKSCVLLKNDGVLPLARGRKIALVGPLADSRANMQGTWAVSAQASDSVTVLEGMQAVFGTDNVLYAKGANLVDDVNIAARLNVFGETFAIDTCSPDELIADALKQAKAADVIVACVGEAKEHTGESSTRSTLELPGHQRRLLEALLGAGKPLVLVTMSGRPLALEWEDRHANAILHAWFAGTESGHAIADLLIGAANPSAKLAMSFPHDSGQSPLTYAEAPTGRPCDKVGIDVQGDEETAAGGRRVFRKFTTACRIEGPHTALYPFGYGLSYSRFEYGEVQLDRGEAAGEQDAIVASVEVRNAGARAGEEIVQLYIGDPVASRSRSVRELKGFEKIALQPGESRRVSFRITVEQLRFFRADTLAAPEHIWEPGEFIVEVGASSERLSAARITWRARK